MTLFRFFLTCGKVEGTTYAVIHDGRVEISCHSWNDLMQEVNDSPFRDRLVFKWYAAHNDDLSNIEIRAYV